MKQKETGERVIKHEHSNYLLLLVKFSTLLWTGEVEGGRFCIENSNENIMAECWWCLDIYSQLLHFIEI